MVTNSIVFERLLLGLGSRSYPIYIGYDILGRLGELCPNLSGKAIVIVSNQNVAKHFLPVIENALRKSNAQTFSIILPDGEKEKKLIKRFNAKTVLFGDTDMTAIYRYLTTC